MNMMCLGDEDTGELDVQNTGELYNEYDVFRWRGFRRTGCIEYRRTINEHDVFR